MPLQSNLFKGDAALEACAENHTAHILLGASGPHVGKIQAALNYLDGLTIDDSELAARRYGPSTAAAVLAYKKARHIINHAYQTQEDDIVGVMTIAALDRDLLDRQVIPGRSAPHACWRHSRLVGAAERQMQVAAFARRSGIRSV